MTKEEIQKNDNWYANVCIEQMKILESMNQCIAKKPSWDENDFKLLHTNIARMINLYHEYQSAI